MSEKPVTQGDLKELVSALMLSGAEDRKATLGLVKTLVDRLDRLEGDQTPEGALERMRARRAPQGGVTLLLRDVLSPYTGCTLDLVLRTEKADSPVLRIENIRLPKGATTHVRHGGIVPDGTDIWPRGNGRPARVGKPEDPSEDVIFDESGFTPEYKAWRLESLLQPDRINFIGKPVPLHLRPNPTTKAA